MAKRVLRAELRRLLAGVAPDAAAAWSLAACRHVMASRAFAEARTVLLYLPLPGEVDVRALAEECFASGRRVCVPRIGWDDRTLTPVRISSFDGPFVTTRHGVPEPLPSAPAVPADEPELIVAPGLGFDRFGGRLGRGAGFYDRYLARAQASARRPVSCGIGFHAQLIFHVPADEHDARLDALATDQGFMDFSGV